jgi:apolipoprotein D and lipocalin family protein
MNTLKFLVASSILMLILSCSSLPEGAKAVENFEKENYLGKWYEIARLDVSFEKNLNNTSAEYSINEDGTIRVVNSGYNTKKKKWTKAVGKAKFAENENIGRLKVSFFGPFYGGYNVVALDSEYQYALVAGSSLKYLWILSRETSIPEKVKKDYLKTAREIGYKTEELLWIEHDK